jgi:uncharacterized protein
LPKDPIIDFSTHLLSKTVIKEIEVARERHGVKLKLEFDPRNSDVNERIGIMDRYGIDKQVLTFNSTQLSGLPADDCIKIGRLANKDLAEFCQKRPNKFTGFIHVSLLDIDDAIEELDTGIRDYGFKGVILATNENGLALDDQNFDRFYARVAKYDVPIFLHPTTWTGYPPADGAVMISYGWPFDTTQAAWRIRTSGILDRYPNLKFMIHHLGAMLPFFYGRTEERLYRLGINMPQSEYWKQFYGDTALSGGLIEAYMLGFAFFGKDRVVFGTDYPYGQEGGEAYIRKNLEAVMKMRIDDEARTKILCTNAMKLLKLS